MATRVVDATVVSGRIGTLRARAVILACVLAGACGGAPAAEAPPSLPSASSGSDPQPIRNIASLLDTCPSRDPAYARIVQDLKIRRNGVVVSDIPCTEPITSLPIAQWTDELIALQAFRVMYHMDAGMTNHLPWTGGSVYAWFASKVGGVTVNDNSRINSCCTIYDGARFINQVPGDEFNRHIDRSWDGLSGNIALYLHEARHVDGYPHVSCCGTAGGCDQTYDERNLSPYGLQYWIGRAWLQGTINVGVSCIAASESRRILNSQLSSANGYVSRFCDTRPPTLAMPPAPGGVCR